MAHAATHEQLYALHQRKLERQAQRQHHLPGKRLNLGLGLG